MRDTIVVTGASGPVGRAVAERLLAAEQHSVRVVGRSASNLQSLADRGAEMRVGTFQDPEFLTEAFRGATAALVMTPLDITHHDIYTEQRRNVEGISAAVEKSGLRKVVALSSWGADVPDKVGGIVGCRWLEQAIDRIRGIDVVHPRPVWFMENFFWNIPLIKNAGVIGMATSAEVSFPMICSQDVAATAAQYLATLDFLGSDVHCLNGPKDYTMPQATRILGTSIGRPDLRYVEFPGAVMLDGLIHQGGLSRSAAGSAIEINQAINSGHLRSEPRSARNTTPTTLEQFADSVFAPRFRQSRGTP